jgi:hypothetical protein
VQHGRHVGKEAVHEQGFAEHRAETDLRQWITEDGAVIRPERGEIEAARRFREAAKAGNGDRQHERLAHQDRHDVTGRRAERFQAYRLRPQSMSPTSAPTISWKSRFLKLRK